MSQSVVSTQILHPVWLTSECIHSGQVYHKGIIMMKWVIYHTLLCVEVYRGLGDTPRWIFF